MGKIKCGGISGEANPIAVKKLSKNAIFRLCNPAVRKYHRHILFDLFPVF
jgi:hypothetical protein